MSYVLITFSILPEDVRTIYLMCGYEAAILGSSPWCQLFEEEDMKILEYLGDLKVRIDVWKEC